MKMQKVLVVFLGIGLFAIAMLSSLSAQVVDRKELVAALKTIDTNIVKYFPRWRICERDLQIQIYQTFLLFGYPKENLDMNNIIITAAPKVEPGMPYTLLLVECGSEKMVASEIDAYMERLAAIISGDVVYSGPYKGEPADGKRTYCYEDIPPEIPPTEAQAEAIINFLEPTDVDHAFTLSVFEQGLKIGDSGFWLRAKLGTDEVGYHFWSAGEAKILLKRPLIVNTDMQTHKAIPFLLNAYLGGGYRLTSGLNPKNTLFEFVPARRLNAGPGGKIVGGFEFFLPLHPAFGVRTNIEIPLQSADGQQINPTTYAKYQRSGVQFIRGGDPTRRITGIAPLLRSTGQVALFYHWWINPAAPENFFRLDLGVSYAEIQEMAVVRDTSGVVRLQRSGIAGLRTYHPDEFLDWLYARLEYRHQSSYPFGVSVQFSNQILLVHGYLPIVGRWLYLEGKYATPLRDAYPFEVKNFFMLSPVLRLTL